MPWQVRWEVVEGSWPSLSSIAGGSDRVLIDRNVPIQKSDECVKGRFVEVRPPPGGALADHRVLDPDAAAGVRVARLARLTPGCRGCSASSNSPVGAASRARRQLGTVRAR